MIISYPIYVRIGGRWACLCAAFDWFNRAVIVWSVGHNEQGELIQQTFLKTAYPLTAIEIYHTDRVIGFDTQRMDQRRDAFTGRRYLSGKVNLWTMWPLNCSTMSIRLKFIRGQSFQSIEPFKMDFFEYNDWSNHHQIHGSLGYQTHIEYRQTLEK